MLQNCYIDTVLPSMKTAFETVNLLALIGGQCYAENVLRNLIKFDVNPSCKCTLSTYAIKFTNTSHN